MKLSPGILMDEEKIIFSAVLIIVAIASKWFCTYLIVKNKIEMKPKAIAWGMVLRGIPGFTFASIAVAGGLISSELFTVLVLIISATTWIGLLGLEMSLKSGSQSHK